jgi:dihydropteroate synthase
LFFLIKVKLFLKMFKDTNFKSLNCRGKLVEITKPVVMGILNVTPDSFFDGNKYHTENQVLLQVEKMLLEGATFIDIGGMSTRPGAEMISEEVELQRVIPFIEQIIKRFPEVLLSVDTFRSRVAMHAINAGACIVNDVSAGELDAEMFALIAKYKNVPYIIMHMRGTPTTMKSLTDYDDVSLEIIQYFIPKIEKLRALKVVDIVLDPGFGFAKTLDQNYELLSKLHTFSLLDLPILAGISRKSMLNKLLDIKPEDALSATSALHMAVLQQGANILRVHDVKEAVQVIQLWNKLEASNL